MAENKNVKIQMGIFFCVYILFYLTKTLLMDCFGIGENLRNPVSLVFYIVTGLAGLYIFRKDFIDGLKEWKEHLGKNIAVFIGVLILNMVLGAVANIPAYIIWPNADTINNTNINNFISTSSPFWVIISIGILGPIVEEIIFRILFIKKASSKVNTVICIIISSVLFMFLHCHALTPMEIMMNMDKLVTGLLFGTALVVTKNPTVPTLVHIINNTLGVVILLNSL